MILRICLFNLIFYISIILIGIIFLPVLISRSYTSKVVRLWSDMIIFSLKKILNIKIGFDDKYIKNKSGIIIAANHQSAFDTVFFLSLSEKTIYIIKKELQYIPIYGWYATRLGNVFIDREKKFESINKLSKQAKKLIKDGNNIIIFPEGTRQPYKKIGKIKPGVFILQKNLKVPIYPVYINSGKTWPKNSFKLKKENILVKSLKPIPFGLDKESFKQKLKTIYESNIKD